MTVFLKYDLALKNLKNRNSHFFNILTIYAILIKYSFKSFKQLKILKEEHDHQGHLLTIYERNEKPFSAFNNKKVFIFWL